MMLMMASPPSSSASSSLSSSAVTMLSPAMATLMTVQSAQLMVRMKTMGTRLEYMTLQTTENVSAIVLTRAEGWRKAGQGRVVAWKADAFFYEQSEGELELHLADDEQDVDELCIMIYSMSRRERILPNPASPFKIQNACGAWTYPGARNWEYIVRPLTASVALRRQLAPPPPKKSKKPHHHHNAGQQQYECIHALSATFVMTKSYHRMDFKGARSFRRMQDDWLSLLGNVSPAYLLTENISCSVYMLLLRADLGYTLLLSHPNYLLLRVFHGCENPQLRLDEYHVCDVLELAGIRWDYSLWQMGAMDHSFVRLGTTTLEISRKGGVVMRMIFPKNTVWSQEAETSVLDSCYALWCGLRYALAGYPWTSQQSRLPAIIAPAIIIEPATLNPVL